MRSDSSSFLSLHCGFGENLPSMPHSIINWMWSCKCWWLSCLPQNLFLRWMQLALPKPSDSPSTHGAGPFLSECVSDRHWSQYGHWQGFPWGYIIVLIFYLCRNRNSHVCTVNCSVNPMGQDSQSTEVKRKLPSMLSRGGRQHISNMDG